MTRLWLGTVALCASIAAGVGEFVAVTDWIPHAGHHGQAPTTPGYVALYCLLVLMSVGVWGLLAGLAVLVATDDL